LIAYDDADLMSSRPVVVCFLIVVDNLSATYADLGVGAGGVCLQLLFIKKNFKFATQNPPKYAVLKSKIKKFLIPPPDLSPVARGKPPPHTVTSTRSASSGPGFYRLRCSTCLPQLQFLDPPMVCN